jgi:hypothetical protein
MDIFKLIYEHDLRLDALRERHLDRSEQQTSSTLEDFLKPDPTYSKLESLIDRIIEGNIADNQLNDCPLTFRQIKIIKDSFLNILVGVYHKRVEYPEEKKEKPEKEQEQIPENSTDKKEEPEQNEETDHKETGE